MDPLRTSGKLILFLVIGLQGCGAGEELSLAERVGTRDYPSVFQAWNPADNLDEDPLITLARHDLVFQGADFYGLEWDNGHTGLAEGFTPASIRRARGFREQVLRLNPRMVFLLEIRYRDAPPEYLPEGHAWWMTDTAGNFVPGWKEGGFIRMELRDSLFRENIAIKAEAALSSGVVDGVMLDWWNEGEWGDERLAILRRIRARVPADALVMVNANHRRVPRSAPMVNGLFMECYTASDEGDWEQIRTTLRWAESSLREPRINCMEAWFDHSREDLYKMRAVTTLALTHSDGYVLFSDPNRLPVPDHLHDWYPFWDEPLGTPVSDLTRQASGAFSREFTGGTALYNPMGNSPAEMIFGEPRRSAATGRTSKVHRVGSYDGDLFLKTNQEPNQTDIE